MNILYILSVLTIFLIKQKNINRVNASCNYVFSLFVKKRITQKQGNTNDGDDDVLQCIFCNLAIGQRINVGTPKSHGHGAGLDAISNDWMVSLRHINDKLCFKCEPISPGSTSHMPCYMCTPHTHYLLIAEAKSHPSTILIEFRRCLLKVKRELQFWMLGSTAFQIRMEDGINEFLNETAAHVCHYYL